MNENKGRHLHIPGIPFHKMHGAGNDFVMLLKQDLPSFPLGPKRIAQLCDRRLGIGADGLIIVEPTTDDVSFRMHYFNSDGHEAEMCGNGARCAFALAHAVGIVGPSGTFASASGLHSGRILGHQEVEVQLPGWSDLELSLHLEGIPWSSVGFCNTGVPHTVISMPDLASLDALDIDHWGPVIRNHIHFGSAGCNVNWMALDPESGVAHLRTFERGVESETLACGTGASAAAVIWCLQGVAKSPVQILTRGGDTLIIKVDVKDKVLFLRGPVVESFQGEVVIDE